MGSGYGPAIAGNALASLSSVIAHIRHKSSVNFAPPASKHLEKWAA
jgi:hypothetical protein